MNTIVKEKQQINRATLALIGSAIFWGASGLATQIALQDVSVNELIFIRFLIAFLTGVVFFLISPARGDFKQLVAPDTLIYSFFLALPLLAVYYASTYALYYTSPAQVAFITSASVVLVPLINHLLFKQGIKKSTLLFSFLTFIGLAIIALQGSFSIDINLGISLSFVNAMAYAFYIVLVGRVPKTVSIKALNLNQYAMVSIFSTFFILASNGSDLFSSIGPGSWAALIFLGIFSTFGAFTLQLWSQQVIEPNRASGLLSLIPVFTALFDVFFAAAPTLHTLIGGTIIISTQLLSRNHVPKEEACT